MVVLHRWFRSLDVDGCESFNLEGLLKSVGIAITRVGESHPKGEINDGEMAPIAMSSAKILQRVRWEVVVAENLGRKAESRLRQSDFGKSGCDHQ